MCVRSTFIDTSLGVLEIIIEVAGVMTVPGIFNAVASLDK